MKMHYLLPQSWVNGVLEGHSHFCVVIYFFMNLLKSFENSN